MARQSNVWIGAACALLFACDDGSGAPSDPPNSEHSGSETSGSEHSKAEESHDAESDGAATSGASAASGSDSKSKPKSKDKTPKSEPKQEPQTEFESADLQSTGSSSTNSTSGGVTMAGTGAAGSAASAGAPITPSGTTTAPGGASKPGAQIEVARGDIFRVLGDKRILNLNMYRGVQVLDVSDLSKPRVEGRLPVTGTPLEMYVVGDRAFVLLNSWTGYYGSRDKLELRAASGGLVMSVDIKDRANPKLIDQAEIQGQILTSRLTQGSDGQAALYVAGTYYDQQAHTIVKSFEVSSGELMAKSELDLGGQVQDIQATTELMMVASLDYTKMAQTSTVTVIDISRTDGNMVKGGSVVAQGWVSNKFNMDAYKGVLRVVSGSQWGSSQENRLETFSLSNLQDLKPIDSCKLTARDPSLTNEQLYATVFVENRGFFVTYYRKDPFHAFSIDDAGKCAEHSQFIVSGWNDFLRPAINNTRLLGIGHNDENNARLLSVSLYDAVNLDNATPLLARADIELNDAASEANWDDRAFSVLENAVSIPAADGTAETGLVLLPYVGWNNTTQSQIAKVQLFTFSDHTLTKRGSMDHGTPVRRSFGVEPDTTGNLSDDALSLFDTSNPDQPAQISRLDVAPSHSRVIKYGDYVARLRDNTVYSYTPGQKLPQSTMQIVSAAGDIEANPALASFDVPAVGQLTQVGDLLVSVFSETTYDQTGQNPKTKSQIQVWDLKDPTKPQTRGALETDQLETLGYYPVGPSISARGCFNCGGWYPGSSSTGFVVGASIVFANMKPQQKSQGFATQCDSYPLGRNCTADERGNYTCENPYLSGGITCITPDDGEESCSGQFYRCDDTTGECKQIDEPMFTNRSCNHYERFRYWTSYSFDILDLRDADKPVASKRTELPTDEEGTSVVAAGDTLYYNFQKPYDKPNDERSYVKHYVRLLGFGDPQQVEVSEPINIPGDVIAAVDTTLYTTDLVWKDSNARALVARLDLDGDKARLQSSKVFEDRQISKVKLDGSGHILVNSDPVYPNTAVAVGVGVTTPAAPPVAKMPDRIPAPLAPPEPKSKLSILNDRDLTVLGEAEIDYWASFTDAKKGLALYQVPGGLLVVDVKDATKPKAQAYFPVAGWPSDIVFDGDSILLAAGMYGVYRLDASTFNLLMQ